MKQRWIIVPIDKNAEQALDYNKATEEQLIESSLTPDEFVLLESLGIFQLINEEGSSNIDDYEDDFVSEEEAIKKVIKALRLKEATLDKDLLPLVAKIRTLFEKALIRGTGVYFYF
ncbi:hypothetical protein GVN20_03835 [Runella sp. CRIBMP]|uniref:hypothetical protein n=1 Tax=Runella sp. CRIBMP TaxID=2683261 RepID=UPI001412256A|nr:hypothetical protein [Runella sp. CRIBMP]NBB18478.1 hypothetical protein [Runella sp. CRIBMP]